MFSTSNRRPELLTEESFRSYLRLVEAFFRTTEDPEQIQIDALPLADERRLFPHTLNLIFNDTAVIGGTDILPCTSEHMTRFLDRRLSEPALLSEVHAQFADGSLGYASCNAIYLVSAFVVPAFRRRGLAASATEDSIRRVGISDPVLFSWDYSAEGSSLGRTVAGKLGLEFWARTAK